MGANEDEEKDFGPSFEEQVKFLRKARKVGSTRFQKTTEYNVARKLSAADPGFDQGELDQRLDAALNRETGKDFFDDSLAGAVVGKKSSSNANLRNLFADDDMIVGKPTRMKDAGAFPSSPEVRAEVKPAEANQVEAKQVETKSVETKPVETVESAKIEPSVAAKPKEYMIKLIRRTNSPLVVPPARIEELSAAAPSIEPAAVEPAAVEPVAVAPVVESVPAKPEPSTPGDLRECPRCAELIKKKAVYCRFCQSEVPPYKDEDPPQPPLSDTPVEPAAVRERRHPAGIESDAQLGPLQDPELELEPEIREEQGPEIPQEPEIVEEQPPEDPRIQELRQAFDSIAYQIKITSGFDLTLSGSELTLTINASGQSTDVFNTDLSDDGLQDIFTFSNALIEQYVEVLSSEFGLEFSRPGDIAVRQMEYNDDAQLVPSSPIMCRAPRIDELKALHRAIEYSWPSSYQQEDQLPMRVVFLTDTLVKDEDVGVRIKILEDGRPVLFFSSTLCNHGRPTELDEADEDDYESWQASIMRELAWKTAVDCNKFPLNPDEYESLGWVYVGDGFYALKSKAGDLYLPYGGAEGPEQAWAMCNENGEPLGKNGEIISQASDLVFISNVELRKKAAHAPCGDHFDTVEDYFVDALRCFRQGAEWRSHLGKINPTLYALVKSLDQQSINRCYSPLKSYTGLIRSPNGSLVENNATNQKEVSQFEQKFNGKR